MTAARRRTAAASAVAVLGVLASLLVASVLVAAPAEAATYRYWTYWWVTPGSTSWTFASLGPASDRPRDQSVVGWRFATTTVSGGRATPRVAASFASLCPTLAAQTAPTGNRVAVVVDYGTTRDAPPGETPPNGGKVRVECVTIAPGSNGNAAMRAADVTLRFRSSDGLVCGIDGYPRTECAAVVADPTPTPTTTRSTASTRPVATPSTPARTSVTASAATTSAATVSAPSTTTAATATSAPATTSSAETTEPTPSDEPTLPVSSGAPVAADAEQPGGGSPVGVVLGGLAVLVLGAGAWWTARGRSS